MDAAQPPSREYPGPEGADPAPSPWPVRAWRRSVAFGKDAVTFVAGLLAVLSVLLFAAVVVESLLDKAVTVQPLSVPRSLSDDGLSPDVVALALRDGMNAFADEVKHERGWIEGTQIIDPEEMPNVTVPSVGLSTQALAAEVRAFLKIQNRLVVSGEIVSRDGTFELTLRLNGRPFFHSPQRLARDRLDDLLREGSRAAVQVTQPYVGAVLAFDDGDHEATVVRCEAIIAGQGEAAEVRQARLLKGQSLFLLGRRDAATAEYRTLLKSNPKDAAALTGLGNVLAAQDQREDAIAEYRTAVAADAGYGSAHTNLGRVLLAMGRTADALGEARTGALMNPQVPYAHFVLANALRGSGNTDEAVREYRTAIALKPKLAWVRYEIGQAFSALGLREEAVDALKGAVVMAPRDVDARDALAALLRDLGRPDEAIAEGRAALAIDPKDARAHAALATLFDDLGRHDEASAERKAASGGEGGSR